MGHLLYQVSYSSTANPESDRLPIPQLQNKLFSSQQGMEKTVTEGIPYGCQLSPIKANAHRLRWTFHHKCHLEINPD